MKDRAYRLTTIEILDSQLAEAENQMQILDLEGKVVE